MTQSYFIGIDIGSQGARVTMLDQQGKQAGARESPFSLNDQSRQEQDPLEWWNTCLRLLKELCDECRNEADLSAVKAIAVTSTSGTIIPVDKNNAPLHPAIMYSDPRSAAEGSACKEAATLAGIKGYKAFNASAGLSKMVWFISHYPEKVKQLQYFIHAADFITGKLCGNYAVTDATNALKSGYDLHELRWPEYITESLHVKQEWLQDVVPSGTPVGELNPDLAKVLGLPAGIKVTAGITDGCASQVASGAVNLGNWNTTIGTTLVIKGVTRNEIDDPSGALYCHRHPEGYWMPGGASNTGADWVSRLFGDADLAMLNAGASKIIPTKHLAWPLMQEGERFPFVAPNARGFAPEGLSQVELFAAYMEGVAYIERYAFERISELSGENINEVYVAGGGSNSDTWLKIRSSVLNLPICKMKNTSGAAGAAVVAASQTYFENLSAAATAMIQPLQRILPDPQLVQQYEDNYQRFKQELLRKGYI
ncbi:FGGY-family carbohydrate kinase [Flavitalea antarctica]